MKVRIKFSKYGSMKFIGHLDVMRYFQKAIRRAGIDIAYSEGFSPHQIMSFAAPLSVGYTSEGEYFDIELRTPMEEEELQKRLQGAMVEGIDILRVQNLPEGEGNAMASVQAASYLAGFRSLSFLPEDWEDRLLAFYNSPTIPVNKKTKRGEKEIDLKESIYQFEIREIPEKCALLEAAAGHKGIYMLLNASSGGNIKPSFVMETFLAAIGVTLPEYGLVIHRVETYKASETGEIGDWKALI